MNSMEMLGSPNSPIEFPGLEALDSYYTPLSEMVVAETPDSEMIVAETPEYEMVVAETPEYEMVVAETPYSEMVVAETPNFENRAAAKAEKWRIWELQMLGMWVPSVLKLI